MTTLDRQPDQAEPPTDLQPAHGRLRFVTAASLFDGHDASINIMRRILQSQGAEVIHLAHNRSVDEVVNAAIQEDAHGIAVSSYQGGHVEYFKYMRELLNERGAGHIQVFGGGGGVIVPAEIRELQDAGVIIYSPEDGQRLGLVGMIQDVMRRAAAAQRPATPALSDVQTGDRVALARYISALENDQASPAEREALRGQVAGVTTPVLGITGTGAQAKAA
ncbi:cobalamin-dependent protein [Deinococcus radiophilus]|uniref:cobalamin-dependent protein n=1 Tax=Deinococcus radiophilus TaxID=32062 RepID=UPI00361D3BB9